MTIIEHVTEETIRNFVSQVSDAHHAMAGAVISASAAQAAALGEACMQISFDNQVDKLDWGDVSTRIAQMAQIKGDLLSLCDQDADAIAQYVALTEADQALEGQKELCDGPAEIARLSADAAGLLQDFRSLVIEQVQDDLEMALSLLAGTARAALLLLDSNLRHWPEPDLLAAYEPVLTSIDAQINQLSPVMRIRN